MAYKGTLTHTPVSGAIAPSSWGLEVNANFSALDDYFHMPLFPDSSGQVDASLAAARYSIVSSSAGGTPNVEFPILSFNGTATSGRKWTKSTPPGYTGSLIVRGDYYMPVAGSATFVLGVRVAAFTVAGTATSKAFGAQTLGTVTADTHIGAIAAFSITIADADSLAAGVPVQIELERLPTNAGDTEAGTVNVTNVDAYFSLS
jgi:hypothetical protein